MAGAEELLAAIRAGDVARATAALDERGATLTDVLKETTGSCALHNAAFHGQLKLCELFLSGGRK